MIDVSVIINTRNEEKNIGACIESVLASDYPQDKIEIIVVDCSEHYRVVNAVRPYNKPYGVKLYRTEVGSARQKNYGANEASGKYLLFLDGDMTIHTMLIQACMTQCEGLGKGYIYIHERVIGTGIWIKARDFERQFYNYTCINAPRFIDKDVFDSYDGYDEKVFSTEDWDLNNRLRKFLPQLWPYVYLPLYHNEGHIKLWRFLMRKKEYASQMGYYIKKWGKDDPIIKKQLGFKYRYWTVFTEHGKWKRLIRHPILTAQMYFIKILTGITYLIWKKH